MRCSRWFRVPWLAFGAQGWVRGGARAVSVGTRAAGLRVKAGFLGRPRLAKRSDRGNVAAVNFRVRFSLLVLTGAMAVGPCVAAAAADAPPSAESPSTPGAQSPEAAPPVVGRPATVWELATLNDSLYKVADSLSRWAYTEHRVVRDGKGRVKSEQVVRFDPSKPYPEQWTPVQINGKAPSSRDEAKYRRRGEDSDPERPQTSSRRTQPSLGEVLDVSRAFVVSESPTHWVFEIPLLKFGNERFPPEKFQVQARLRREGALLENLSVLLRESFRSKLVVKVKSGDASLDFAQVDPKHPPTLVAISGDADWSILFIGGGGSIDLKRTELRRVKPYGERFEVKIGTLKAIDF